MMFMQELDLPNGVEIKVEEGSVTVKGRMGSAEKKINSRLVLLEVSPGKLTIKESDNKKLARKSSLAVQSLSSELKSTIHGVTDGIERRMSIVYAHFPMTIEVKGDTVYIKNIFGERVPRVTKIAGNTKVEVKGQELRVKGVDQYDVGQTMANIKKACFARGYDTRVFQDGIYHVKED
jgi:large subunit ribosomal protein L6